MTSTSVFATVLGPLVNITVMTFSQQGQQGQMVPQVHLDQLCMFVKENCQKGKNHASGSLESDRAVTMVTMESVVLVMIQYCISYLIFCHSMHYKRGWF